MQSNIILFYSLLSVFIFSFYITYGIRLYLDNNIKKKYYPLILCYPIVLYYNKQKIREQYIEEIETEIETEIEPYIEETEIII